MKIDKPALRDNFYFSRYIDLALEGDLLASLEASYEETTNLLRSLTEAQASFKYQEDKWTVKEVLAHCIDTERILSYRALCFSRKEELMLPGFDQDQYQEEENSTFRSLPDLLEEYELVRRSTIHLFKRMKSENLDFTGIASNVDISPRELGWTIAGHDLHHLNVLKEKYKIDAPNRGSVSISFDA